MGLTYVRARLNGILLLVKSASLLYLGPMGAIGHIGPSVTGGLFGCPFTVPFILCPICPAPCTFSIIRPWLFGVILASSLLFGRIFCGLLCPAGVLSDFLHRIPTMKLEPKSVFNRLVFMKYSALILFLYLISEAALILLGLMPVEGLWALLINYREKLILLVIVALTVVLISSVFSHRPWCRYICPVSTIFSASNRFSLISIERSPEVCGECNSCVSGCPMDLTDPGSPDCIRCLSCYAECEKGVSRLKAKYLFS